MRAPACAFAHDVYLATFVRVNASYDASRCPLSRGSRKIDQTLPASSKGGARSPAPAYIPPRSGSELVNDREPVRVGSCASLFRSAILTRRKVDEFSASGSAPRGNVPFISQYRDHLTTETRKEIPRNYGTRPVHGVQCHPESPPRILAASTVLSPLPIDVRGVSRDVILPWNSIFSIDARAHEREELPISFCPRNEPDYR